MPTHDTTVSRRTVLKAAAGVAATGALAGVPTATAASPFGGWLSNTSNFDGLVDRTGAETVTITVGVSGNGGPNGFGPAAVRVDPGTTVVWEWSGDGYHNVKAEDGSFESALTDSAGTTFEQTFDSEGVKKYFCVPHEPMGMKGVVVVGDVDVGGDDAGQSASSGPDYGDWFENVSNFEGTVDKTGRDEVTITVGARGNNGAFAFDPPAVEVDPGTSIVWEWTGQGGTHNVVAEDGSFESELVGEAGYTFEQTVTSGLHKYACTPHKPMGMRGAIVVAGSSTATGSGLEAGEWLTLGGGIGLTGAILGLFGNAVRENRSGRPPE